MGIGHVLDHLLSQREETVRERPASLSATALSAILAGHIGRATIRDRAANCASVDELLDWIAVDRLIEAGRGLNTRALAKLPSGEALQAAVDGLSGE